MDAGYGSSAIPIYQHFVQTVDQLEVPYASLVMPARWYAGGRGLTPFREFMLNNPHLEKIVDFPTATDVFPDVDIAGGVCFILLNSKKESDVTEIVNVNKGAETIRNRSLNIYPILIRDNKAVDIIEKISKKHEGRYLNTVVSPSKPFGLRTFYKPTSQGIPCQFIQKIGLKFADPKDVKDQYNLLDKWKFLAPKAPIAGQTDFNKPVGFYYSGNTFIGKPGECCTESFIVLYNAESKTEVENFKSYIFTKIARFLLLQAVVSQDVTREKFIFVPDLGEYTQQYTDEYLRKLWDITEEEWEYIDSKIK